MARLTTLTTLAVGLPGCGSDQSAMPSDGGVLDGGEATIDPTLVLDDFEDGNNQITIVAGRAGGWFAYGDDTVGGRIQPVGDASPELIPGGRGASKRALHVTSTGFLDWGSGVSAAVHWGTNAAGVSGLLPYDAHVYKGVTLHARVGDTSGTAIRIQFNDRVTRPEGGLCTEGGPPGQECYDGFGVDLPALSTSWQSFKIPFAGLGQRGFGLAAPALDTSALYEIGFAFPPAVVTDFWVDDLRFYE